VLSLKRSWAEAFTLIELLVSVAVLIMLVVMAAQLLNSAAAITSLGQKRMDADSQARQLLDRMAIDFAQMIKRPDVDYYLKSSATAAPDCTTCAAQTNGNDQIAVFTALAGYYPTPSSQSPISLIGYRVNSSSTSSSYNKVERLSKGFIWNGVSPSYKPILFLDSATAPTTTISNQWPAAVSSTAVDSDCSNTGCYEVAGSQVFRFEYYYLLKNGSFSDTPWDIAGGHTNVAGMRDVAAIIADIAVIDTRSKLLLTNSQIATLNGASGQPPILVNYATGMLPGQLGASWQSALDGVTNLPRPAISGVRLYERFFYLSPPTLGTP
jgi:type II secretory pathway component PulJ